MGKPKRSASFDLASDAAFAVKKRQRPPFEFVLDALAAVSPWTRPMFGCLAVYVEEKIVLILRDRADRPSDNGVWIATSADHHESLRRELPRMRTIQLFGIKETHWQVLPADAPDFEESVLRACELICAGDPRIGRIPKSRGTRRAKKVR
jgi:hypothetical protein